MGGIPAIFARIRRPPGVQNELRLVVEDGEDVGIQRKRREAKRSQTWRGGCVEIRKAKA
jgi:hypothetical protein